MAKLTFMEESEYGTQDLAGRFITVDTRHDGYTSTHEGQYIFYIEETTQEEDEDSEYQIFSTYFRHDGVLVNAKYPVLITEEDHIFFSVNTLKDPYGFAYPEKMDIPEGRNRVEMILAAFSAFTHDRFRLGDYNIFITDAPMLEDGEEFEFERIDELERDVIHPWAGLRNPNERI